MKSCSLDGCDKKHFARDFCRNHYENFMRHGSPHSKYDKRGYDKIDDAKDTRPGHRGYLAVNIINDIKSKALLRKKIWDITHIHAFILIKSPCTYCGFEPIWPKSRVGIDRVDTSKGYIIGNVVSCCSQCNNSKGISTVEEFKDRIKKQYARLELF